MLLDNAMLKNIQLDDVTLAAFPSGEATGLIAMATHQASKLRAARLASQSIAGTVQAKEKFKGVRH